MIGEIVILAPTIGPHPRVGVLQGVRHQKSNITPRLQLSPCVLEVRMRKNETFRKANDLPKLRVGRSAPRDVR